MGNSESHTDGGNDMSQYDGVDTLGYRVLGVQPNSPASQAGLVSFFDFLVGVNGQLIFGVSGNNGEGSADQGNNEEEYYEDVDFPALLKGSINQEIELLVWNIKSQTQRFINLTPSTSWGGTGLLGVTIRIDNYATAEENLLRVLSIDKLATSTTLSPAAMAGLTPTTDYLLGTTIESFESEDTLADVLEEHQDRVLEVYVYNTESDVVRVVTLVPSLSWGGRGLLGAEVGRGYLHRLPKSCRGTLGVSFERRVTTTAPLVPLENDDENKIKMAEGDTDTSEGNLNDLHSGSGSLNTEQKGADVNSNNCALKNEDDAGQQVLEDLSQLTCAVSGNTVQFAPQMEMEQVPKEESSLNPNVATSMIEAQKLEQRLAQEEQLSFSQRGDEQEQQVENKTDIPTETVAEETTPTEVVSPTNSLPPMPTISSDTNANNDIGDQHDMVDASDDADVILDLPPPPISHITAE